jgi:hypothetical protein
MLPRCIDVITDEGTAVADVVGSGRQHEVIDGKLAAAVKEIGKRPLPVCPFKDIGLFDFDPWKLAARRSNRVELAGQLLLTGQEILARSEPLFP